MKAAMAAAMAAGVAVCLLAGCFGIPKGTTAKAAAGSSQIMAAGAGIVGADAQKTRIRIRCGRCGFQSEEIEVPTPTSDKPYQTEWVCPRCGHRQKILVRVAP